MTDQIESTKPTFASYGRTFQEAVVQGLLSDKRWAEQMLEVIDVSYFDLKYLQYLSAQYFAYSKRFKDFPTLQLLVTIIREDLKNGTDTLLRDQIIDYLQRMRANPNPGDLPFVKEKSLDFCRKQALRSALEQAVDLVATEKYESVVEVIRKAVSVGTTPSIGHDFQLDVDARFLKHKRDVVPTGIPELDRKEILNGGLGRGELGCAMGGTGIGKSHFLVMLGANALRAGKNVLHYTFELSETQVGIRYDSNLCDMPSNEVIDCKEQVIERYKGMKLGRLMIKEYPSSTATIYTLRSHIEKLQLRGFVPDVILIDYADIMRSTRQYDSLRHELKLIYEELRSYAAELGVPIWTASQNNRQAAETEIVGLDSMSESYGKAFVCDVVLSISRRMAEKSSGMGRLYLAKNRAGRDGLVYSIKIDTARSSFAIMSDASSPAEANHENESEIKRALRDKMRELEADRSLGVRNLPAG